MEILDNIGRKVQADFDRMQPVIQHIIFVQQRLIETYAPIFEAMSRLRETMRPLIEFSSQMNSMVKYLQPPSEPELVVTMPLYRPKPIHYIEQIEEVSIQAVVNLPEDALWAKLENRFVDTHTVSVWYDGKKIGNYDYEALGFARMNTKDHKPDKQWHLLRRLAIISSSNNKVRPTFAELFTQPAKNNQACHKLKHNLSKKLKLAFGIAEDPFYKYDDYAGYRLKFKILPEPDLRGDGQIRTSGSPLFEREFDEEDED